MSKRLRLSTTLSITHGVLVALLLLLLVVALQGSLRMVSLIADVSDAHLSTLDAEEELHRAAWRIEVGIRHGRVACSTGNFGDAHRLEIEQGALALRDVAARRAPDTPLRLRAATNSYLALASASLRGEPCANLLAASTDERRAALDEELTNAWIDRLHEVHTAIEAKEQSARELGVRMAIIAGVVAVIAAVAAAGVARATARSVAGPIAVLSSSARRLGEGDFAPIPSVKGPYEIEELWHDLEKMRERVHELDRLKQSVIASVSHELRSPLARVNEALALLADGTCGPLTEKQARVVTLAVRACHREVRVVDALLDMSRLKSGRPIRREAACDIDRVIDSAVAEERVEAAERGISVEVDRRGVAPSIALDSALVERAVANLIRNAVSVSKSGQRVVVQRSVAAGPQAAIEVDVSDHGPGLPDTMRAALFRPFSAEMVPAADRPAGIGLGLSFVQEVARAHDGDVSVTRSNGTGTTFRMRLPLLSPERA